MPFSALVVLLWSVGFSKSSSTAEVGADDVIFPPSQIRAFAELPTRLGALQAELHLPEHVCMTACKLFRSSWRWTVQVIQCILKEPLVWNSQLLLSRCCDGYYDKVMPPS